MRNDRVELNQWYQVGANPELPKSLVISRDRKEMYIVNDAPLVKTLNLISQNGSSLLIKAFTSDDPNGEHIVIGRGPKGTPEIFVTDGRVNKKETVWGDIILQQATYTYHRFEDGSQIIVTSLKAPELRKVLKAAKAENIEIEIISKHERKGGRKPKESKSFSPES